VPVASQLLPAVQEAVEEAAEDPMDGMWDEHLEAMWKEMSKEELEEEVKWRRSDQKAMAERITYLQAELTKKRTQSSQTKGGGCVAPVPGH